MKRILFDLLSTARLDRLIWGLDTRRLRILMYHGVCEDQFAVEPWVPSSFVSRSALASQLEYLRRCAQVLPLADAISLLQANKLPDRSVAITFDDGYANNLLLAYPLLKSYDMPATIFLSTAYLLTGDFFPFDRLRLIRIASEVNGGVIRALPDGLLAYETNPIDDVLERSADKWRETKSHLSSVQRESLRPLEVNELPQFDPKLVQFGAHSHTHCILRNEMLSRREWEIVHSVENVRDWTGQTAPLFAYPNGSSGDFNELDKCVIRSVGIKAALTTIPGANRTDCDLLELRRYPVGLYHNHPTFAAEVTGFRTALRSLLQ